VRTRLQAPGRHKIRSVSRKTVNVRVHIAAYTRHSLRKVNSVPVRLVVTTFDEGLSTTTTLHTRIAVKAAPAPRGRAKRAVAGAGRLQRDPFVEPETLLLP